MAAEAFVRSDVRWWVRVCQTLCQDFMFPWKRSCLFKTTSARVLIDQTWGPPTDTITTLDCSSSIKREPHIAELTNFGPTGLFFLKVVFRTARKPRSVFVLSIWAQQKHNNNNFSCFAAGPRHNFFANNWPCHTPGGVTCLALHWSTSGLPKLFTWFLTSSSNSALLLWHVPPFLAHKCATPPDAPL